MDDLVENSSPAQHDGCASAQHDPGLDAQHEGERALRVPDVERGHDEAEIDSAGWCS